MQAPSCPHGPLDPSPAECPRKITRTSSEVGRSLVLGGRLRGRLSCQCWMVLDATAACGRCACPARAAGDGRGMHEPWTRRRRGRWRRPRSSTSPLGVPVPPVARPQTKEPSRCRREGLTWRRPLMKSRSRGSFLPGLCWISSASSLVIISSTGSERRFPCSAACPCWTAASMSPARAATTPRVTRASALRMGLRSSP